MKLVVCNVNTSNTTWHDEILQVWMLAFLTVLLWLYFMWTVPFPDRSCQTCALYPFHFMWPLPLPDRSAFLNIKKTCGFFQICPEWSYPYQNPHGFTSPQQTVLENNWKLYSLAWKSTIKTKDFCSSCNLSE